MGSSGKTSSKGGRRPRRSNASTNSSRQSSPGSRQRPRTKERMINSISESALETPSKADFQPSTGLLPNGDVLDQLVDTSISTSQQATTSSTISTGVPFEPSGSIQPALIPSDDDSDEEDDEQRPLATKSKRRRAKRARAAARPLSGEAGRKNCSSSIDHPWYLGYQNSATAPISDSNTVRYGYPGSLNMIRSAIGSESRSVHYGYTNLALKHSLPKFLGEEHIVDEYVPQISGPPRAWKHETNYVTGSKLKTIPPLPELPGHLKAYLEWIDARVSAFNERTLEARIKARNQKVTPMYSVEIDPRTGRPKDEKHKQIQEGKLMRYWTGATVICAKDSDEAAVAVALEKARQASKRMNELKWSESLYLYKLLRSMSIQLKPGLEEYRALLHELKNSVVPISTNSSTGQSRKGKSDPAGEENNDNSDDTDNFNSILSSAEEQRKILEEVGDVCMPREVFVNVVCSHIEHADRRRINKLYSGFDPQRSDLVDYRIVMAAQRCFWRQSEDPADKILALFAVMDQHCGTGILSIEEVNNMMTVCSVYEEECDRILALLSDTRAFFMAQTPYSDPGYIAFEEFEKMLAMYGSVENHPLVHEFGEQLKQRMQLFLLAGANETVPTNPKV